MTPEQAIKHKDVIKWWLENLDKGVWVRDANDIIPEGIGNWSLTNYPEFYEEDLYTQNDEYAELRKKICDLESELSKLKGQIR